VLARAADQADDPDDDASCVVVAPLMDRLVVFQSSLAHAVAPAHFHRVALTAWMVRSLAAGRRVEGRPLK
jgi:Rps23 Pro-64 3,4-dihydroxylase Tpa1-like proline 4-hydroxylase